MSAHDRNPAIKWLRPQLVAPSGILSTGGLGPTNHRSLSWQINSQQLSSDRLLVNEYCVNKQDNRELNVDESEVTLSICLFWNVYPSIGLPLAFLQSKEKKMCFSCLKQIVVGEFCFWQRLRLGHTIQFIKYSNVSIISLCIFYINKKKVSFKIIYLPWPLDIVIAMDNFTKWPETWKNSQPGGDWWR